VEVVAVVQLRLPIYQEKAAEPQWFGRIAELLQLMGLAAVAEEVDVPHQQQQRGVMPLVMAEVEVVPIAAERAQVPKVLLYSHIQ